MEAGTQDLRTATLALSGIERTAMITITAGMSESSAAEGNNQHAEWWRALALFIADVDESARATLRALAQEITGG